MQKHTAGFSLVEIIAVLIIVGVVAGLGAMTLTNVIHGYVMTREAVEITQKGQLALTKIAVELDHVNATGITSYGSTSMTFDSVYGNATLQTVESGHTFTYDGSAGILSFDSTTLADMVTGVQFNYYESDGSTTATDAGDIRVIEVQLTMGGDKVTNKVLTTRVAPLPMQE